MSTTETDEVLTVCSLIDQLQDYVQRHGDAPVVFISDAGILNFCSEKISAEDGAVVLRPDYTT